jgi:hypothetical protein
MKSALIPPVDGLPKLVSDVPILYALWIQIFDLVELALFVPYVCRGFEALQEVPNVAITADSFILSFNHPLRCYYVGTVLPGLETHYNFALAALKLRCNGLKLICIIFFRPKMHFIESTYQFDVGYLFLITLRLEPFRRRVVIDLRADVPPRDVNHKVPVHLVGTYILLVSHHAHHTLLLRVVIHCDF